MAQKHSCLISSLCKCHFSYTQNVPRNLSFLQNRTAFTELRKYFCAILPQVSGNVPDLTFKIMALARHKTFQVFKCLM